MGLYKRGGSWWIDYRVNGKRVREAVGTKEEAETLLGERRQDIRQGRDPGLRRIKPITFHEAAERFMHEYVAITSENPEQFEIRRAPLEEYFGDTYLTMIDRAAVNRYTRQRSAQDKKRRGAGKVSNSTINREIAFLSRLFTWAKYEAAIYGGENPCSRLRLNEPEPDADHFLTPEQVDNLMAASADHLKPIIRFCLGTFARIGSVLLLEWPQVDLTPGAERVTFLGETTKAHRTYSVPLTEDVIAVLRRGPLGVASHKQVFTYQGRPIGRINDSFRRAAKRAGLPSWVTPHSLRHSAAVWFRENGGDLFRLQELMGHSDIKQTMRYAKVSRRYLRDSLAYMGRPVTAAGHNLDTKTRSGSMESAS